MVWWGAMQRLEMEKRQWQDRMDDIGMRVRIKTLGAQRHSLRVKLAQLSEEDRTFFLRSREPELDSKLALENPLARKGWKVQHLCSSKQEEGEQEGGDDSEEGWRRAKFEDYALAFGFGSAKEARSFLNSVA